MTDYDRGDVVLVSFLFSEQDGFKKRPALVLSTGDYHRGRRELIMAAITSNVGRILVGDTKLRDWKKAGLLYPSVVTAIIRTIKQEMVESMLGRLTERDFRSVGSSLKQALGFE